MVEVGYTPLEESQVSPIFSDEEIVQMSERYGTPIFLVNESTLLNRLDALQKAYDGFEGCVSIAYSMKANFNPSVLKVFIPKGVLFDVTSLGELYFFTKSGGLPSSIIYTSVTEEECEFEKALKEGVRHFVVGSYGGLENLVTAANKTGIEVNVMIRINPEVAVKAVVRAAYRNSKFGVPFNNGKRDSASSLLKRILAEPRLNFEGFHFHLGSQIEDSSCYLSTLDKLESFIEKMKRNHPHLSIKVVDIGGGTPVFYGTPIPSPETMGKIVSKRLNTMAERLGEKFTLIVESGRFLSAESSILVARIVNSKIYADRKFIYVDAGFHLLLDAALLRQAYPQYVVPRSFDDDLLKVNLAGRLCDTYDIFPISRASDLKGAEPGRLIVFQNVGAYSLVFGMPFHCQTKPPVFMRRLDGGYDMIRPAQKVEDLFREEGGSFLAYSGGRDSGSSM
ncbi:MAG: diaminopimelate decarboxylase family protein [Nitrososphaerales archaeon]